MWISRKEYENLFSEIEQLKRRLRVAEKRYIEFYHREQEYINETIDAKLARCIFTRIDYQDGNRMITQLKNEAISVIDKTFDELSNKNKGEKPLNTIHQTSISDTLES